MLKGSDAKKSAMKEWVAATDTLLPHGIEEKVVNSQFERIQPLNNVQSQTITPTKGTAVRSSHMGINSCSSSSKLGAQCV